MPVSRPAQLHPLTDAEIDLLVEFAQLNGLHHDACKATRPGQVGSFALTGIAPGDKRFSWYKTRSLTTPICAQYSSGMVVEEHPEGGYFRYATKRTAQGVEQFKPGSGHIVPDPRDDAYTFIFKIGASMVKAGRKVVLPAAVIEAKVGQNLEPSAQALDLAIQQLGATARQGVTATTANHAAVAAVAADAEVVTTTDYRPSAAIVAAADRVLHGIAGIKTLDDQRPSNIDARFLSSERDGVATHYCTLQHRSLALFADGEAATALEAQQKATDRYLARWVQRERTEAMTAEEVERIKAMIDLARQASVAVADPDLAEMHRDLLACANGVRQNAVEAVARVDAENKGGLYLGGNATDSDLDHLKATAGRLHDAHRERAKAKLAGLYIAALGVSPAETDLDALKATAGRLYELRREGDAIGPLMGLQQVYQGRLAAVRARGECLPPPASPAP